MGITGIHYNASGPGQSAPYAPFWHRFVASLIDWIICFWAPFFVLLVLVSALEAVTPETVTWVWAIFPLLALTILAYFTYFLGSGRSLGMRALGLQIVNAKTGKPPGAWRALLKAFLNLVLAASIFYTYAAMWAFGDPVSRTLIDSTELAIYLSSMASFFLLGILARLWMIWDSRKQTWQDKVSAIVVIGKMSPSSRP